MEHKTKVAFMNKTFLLTAAALAALVPASTAQAQSGENPEIVVTGQSLEDSRRALEECLARGCPPEEDIALSLAHAENEFIGGEYEDSRKTLRQSIGRNRKHGDELPVPVSDLYRANSRISAHQGEAKNYQLSVLNMRKTLVKGLGEDDPRALAAQVEVGDSRAKLGYPDEAEGIYKRLQERALELGNGRVATFAILRQALLKQARADDASDNAYKARLNGELTEILSTIRDEPMAGAEDFSLVAEVLLARQARELGDEGATDALLKRYAEGDGATRPILLQTDPLPILSGSEVPLDELNPANTSDLLSALNSVGKWADIGFWVNADGKVDDVEVLRSEGTKRWLKAVIDNLATRGYAPLKRTDNDPAPGFYMIERYSLTARWTNDATGTRLRRREPQLRIERLDITPDNYERPELTKSPAQVADN
jgi:hypothetical protein